MAPEGKTIYLPRFTEQGAKTNPVELNLNWLNNATKKASPMKRLAATDRAK